MGKPYKALLIFFNGKSNAGGAERMVQYLEDWLISRGLKTEIIDEKRLKETWLGRLYWKLFHYRHFKKRKHIYMARFASLYCWWRFRPGIFFISTGESVPFFPLDLGINHGCYHVMEKAYGRKEDELSRIAKLQMRGINRAKQVMAVTEQVKRDLVKYYGTDAAKISVVVNRVDTSYFQVLPKPNVNYKTILYAGRLENGKGLPLLIKLAQLIEHARGWKLLIACNNPINTDQFASLQNTEVVVGLQLHNINELAYSKADLVIFPSLFESFGMVTIEALSAGVPVIATPVGIIPQMLQSNYPGVYELKPFLDESFLDDCAAIIEHFNTNVDRNVLHETVDEEYGIPSYGRRLKDVLGEALGIN